MGWKSGSGGRGVSGARRRGRCSVPAVCQLRYRGAPGAVGRPGVHEWCSKECTGSDLGLRAGTWQTHPGLRSPGSGTEVEAGSVLQGCGLAGRGAPRKRDLVPVCSEGAEALPALCALMIRARSLFVLPPPRGMRAENGVVATKAFQWEDGKPPRPARTPVPSPCPSTTPGAARGPGDAQRAPPAPNPGSALPR